MRVDKNPIHRKAIVPWYDSEIACIIILMLMAVIILFAASGIYVSYEASEYKTYGWVAILLLVLSAWIMVSAGLRLINRYLNRSSN